MCIAGQPGVRLISIFGRRMVAIFAAMRFKLLLIQLKSAIFSKILHISPLFQVHKISCPTLVIHGQKDAMVAEEHVHFLHEVSPSSLLCHPLHDYFLFPGNPLC